MYNSVRSGYTMWIILIVSVMLASCAPAIPGPGEVVKLQPLTAEQVAKQASKQVAESITATNGSVTYYFKPSIKMPDGTMLWGQVCKTANCPVQDTGRAIDSDRLRDFLAALGNAGYTIKIYLVNAAGTFSDIPVLIYTEDMIEKLEWEAPQS